MPPECPPWKTISHVMSVRLSQWVHTLLNSGHLEIQCIIKLVESKVWWPSFPENFTCQSLSSKCNKFTLRDLSTGLLELLPFPHHPWSQISTDYMTDLFPTIFVIIDHFSKSSNIIPLPKLPIVYRGHGSRNGSLVHFKGLQSILAETKHCLQLTKWIK